MKAKDIKVLINHIEDDFKLFINTKDGLIEVDKLEVNYEDCKIIFNQ